MGKPRTSMRPALFGTLAALALLAVYILVLTLVSDFSHAVDQFITLWHWMVPLLVGFGIQVALFAHIRATAASTATGHGAASSVTASGGLSTTSMVACCAHHVTEVLPLLGVSAALVFLNRYQTLFIAVGIASNLIGINLMLNIIQDHGLFGSTGLLSALMRADMRKSFYLTGAFSGLLFLAVLLKGV